MRSPHLTGLILTLCLMFPLIGHAKDLSMCQGFNNNPECVGSLDVKEIVKPQPTTKQIYIDIVSRKAAMEYEQIISYEESKMLKDAVRIRFENNMDKDRIYDVSSILVKGEHIGTKEFEQLKELERRKVNIDTSNILISN